MRFLPTRLHGSLDYLLGALLVASPWLLAFAGGYRAAALVTKKHPADEFAYGRGLA